MMCLSMVQFWRNAKDAVMLFLENSKAEFNRRQANKVAHTLASEAIFSADPHVFSDVPLCILILINNEKL